MNYPNFKKLTTYSDEQTIATNNTTMTKLRIYRREYDNHLMPDGSPKPNKFLGTFKIIETVKNGGYDSIYLGIKNNKVYLIIESEVCGINGGSKCEIHKLNNVTELK